MNPTLKTVLAIAAAAFVLAAATLVVWPHLQKEPAETAPDAEEQEIGDGEEQPEAAEETEPAAKPRPAQTDKPAKTRAQRDKEKFDVGEMRNGAEDMLRRFRGTPEERQDVIEECETGKALLLEIMDISVAAFDEMSPEGLMEAREDFEKEFRAELDYLQTGKLHRMLKTQEEREIIGSSFDVVQQFLETLDNALHAAGY